MSKFSLKQFIRDEHGSITAFVLVMFLTMVVGGGMGVDFMRHESERSMLQSALDRGVLAAASYEVEDEDVDIEQRVISYVHSSKFLKNRNPELLVASDITINSRQVAATGSYAINTFFLKIIGITTLTVSASSAAKITRGEIEISLILDNSGSMDGAKMQNLKDAANDFIDLMLNEETIDYTTISLIPFAAQVNAGPILAEQFNLDRWHDYSWCFALGASDYEGTSLSQETLFTQEQHYFRGQLGTHECPDSPIIPFSNSPARLHTAINNMNAGGYTATYAGMKWGAALLDPAAQPVLTSLAANGVVDPNFIGRPAAWDSEVAAKFIIIMTDGANTEHKRIKPSSYNHEGTDPWQSQANADYWNERGCSWRNGCSVERVISGSSGDLRLQDICDAAKEDIPGSNVDRITVFTIGFDVSEGSNPYNYMRNCASSESKFYHVENTDLATAFKQIAGSITKLKLTD